MLTMTRFYVLFEMISDSSFNAYYCMPRFPMSLPLAVS